MQKQRKSQPEKPDCGGVENDGTAIPRVLFPIHAGMRALQRDTQGKRPTGGAAREIQNGHLQSISPRKPPMAGYNAVPKLIVAPTMPMTLGRSASL